MKYFSKHHQIDKFKYVIGMYSPAHHWFLCIANIEKKLFYFVDPSIATARVKKNRFDTWLQLAELYLTDFNSNDWQQGSFVHAEQNDGFNCGPLCLMFMENILKNTFKVEFDAACLASYRKLLHDLLTSKAKNN